MWFWGAVGCLPPYSWDFWDIFMCFLTAPPKLVFDSTFCQIYSMWYIFHSLGTYSLFPIFICKTTCTGYTPEVAIN